VETVIEIFSGDAIWIIAISCICCASGIVLLLFGQLIGGAFGALFGIVEIFFEFLSAGPVAWCGCLMLLFGCAICSAITLTILQISSTCGTPDAVNFCRLFG
jgi:hypothetical protein